MTAIGYALSSEEHGPRDLVRNAARAEEAGFSFALISDHFHPWIERHPHSPFVWGVLGAIAQATERLVVGTGVTCPTMRIHPAIIAQAAATAADLMPGRFFLGVGTGENLNEHILGQAGPSGTSVPRCSRKPSRSSERCGAARWSAIGAVLPRPERPALHAARDLPPIRVAAGGPKMAELAGRIGDGLIATAPTRELIDASGRRRPWPLIGQVTVCWASPRPRPARTAHEWWPTAALHGEVARSCPTRRSSRTSPSA